MIKVAISQRIIPHYRVPVFEMVSKDENIDITVFYGSGFNEGTEVNAINISRLFSKKIFTIKIPLKVGGTNKLIVLHPTLLFYLILGKYDVVITEPITNILNLFPILFYCKVFKKKLIWHEAGGVKKNNRSIFRKAIDPVIKIFINNSNAFLTYNSYADEFLIENYNVSQNKIFRAQNALDTTEISKQIEIFKDKIFENDIYLKYKDYKKILFLGALDKRKKINNLIKAVAILNEKFKLKSICLIVGDGPDLQWIKDGSTKDDIKNVVFLGKKTLDAVLYILLSDVVVLPGQGGLSINHALACGKPIIATEEAYSPYTKSVYDYIEDNYNGKVAKTDDIVDLADKIYSVLSDNKKYINFSLNSQSKSKELSIENMVKGYINAIKYVLK